MTHLAQLETKGPLTLPSLPQPVASVLDNSFSEYREDRIVERGWIPPARVSYAVRHALPEALVLLEAAAKPATTSDVVILLARLSLHFRLRDLSETEFELLIEDYVEDLAGLSITALAEACRSWRQNEKWWPTVVEFKTLAAKHDHKIQENLIRARFLAWCIEKFDGQVPTFEYTGYGQDHGVHRFELETAMSGEPTSFRYRIIMPAPSQG